MEGVERNLFRHGLYLGSEMFSEKCIQRFKREGSSEKPQMRSLLRSRNIGVLATEILRRLGEKNLQAIFNVRKYRCRNRDVTIYILYQLGAYLNAEIGKVFGVGYTAIPGAVRRGKEFIDSDGRLEERVNRIIDDI